jgi:hypothetical protein
MSKDGQDDLTEALECPREPSGLSWALSGPFRVLRASERLSDGLAPVAAQDLTRTMIALGPAIVDGRTVLRAGCQGCGFVWDAEAPDLRNLFWQSATVVAVVNAMFAAADRSGCPHWQRYLKAVLARRLAGQAVPGF